MSTKPGDDPSNETELDMKEQYRQDMRLLARVGLLHKCERCHDAPAETQAAIPDWFADWYQDLCQECADALTKRELLRKRGD